MSAAIGVVVRCGHVPRLLWPSLRSLDTQTSPLSGLVLVIDPSTPQSAHSWIDGLAASRGARVARCSSTAPGAIANAGIAAMDELIDVVVVLDSGNRLEARGLERIAALVEADSDAAFLLLGSRAIGPGSSSTTEVPIGHDAAALVLAPEAAHRTTPFRRTALAAIGGFDETMPTFEAADAALRLLEAGWAGASTAEPLLVRWTDGPGPEHDQRDPERWTSGLELLVSRHRDAFTRDPSRVLFACEERLRLIANRYRAALAARDEGISEIEALRAASEGLHGRLSEAGANHIDLGDLHRVTPVSRNWGYERGVPIDRYYIERFLEAHADDIRGRVLEVQEADYTRRFGGDRVVASDVLDLDPANARASVVADLREAPNLASGSYDCIVLTQVIHVIDDMRLVAAECARLLRPGGVLLVTMPCASRVCLEYGRDGDFWRVTEAGARQVFEAVFDPLGLSVTAHGNVLVSAAFQYGLAVHELRPADFETDDPFNPLIVTVRAVARGGPVAGAPTVIRSARADSPPTGIVLMYHRVAAARSDGHGLCVSRPLFERHMAHIAATCHPMPLTELADAAASSTLPPRSVAVTLDDGYLDALTDAAGVLAGARVPATVFVATADLHGPGHYRYWWDVLEWALLDAEPPSSTLTVLLPDGPRSFPMGLRLERLDAHRALHSVLVPLGPSDRDRVLSALVAWHGGVPDRVPRRMTASELRALASYQSITVGAHTVHHVALPAHPAPDQAREILASRKALERVLGRPVTAFAYPYGAWSPDTRAIVRRAGFEVAVTCDEGSIRRDTDRLALPRIEVKETSFEAFAAGLSRAFATLSAG